METEQGVLVLKRIHVTYHLKGASDQVETVNRVHAIHQDHCPIYRSIHQAIDITTEVKLI